VPPLRPRVGAEPWFLAPPYLLPLLLLMMMQPSTRFVFQGLVETYHGVNVDIRYCIEVDIARGSMFSNNIHGEAEFHVETPAGQDQQAAQAEDFEITPTELQNVKSSSMDKIPRKLAKCALPLMLFAKAATATYCTALQASTSLVA